jgi:hypothetical protein
MKILFLLLGFIINFTLQAQTKKMDTWIISHNAKQKIRTSQEAPEKNVVTITKADLMKSGHVFVNYTDNNKEKGWKRTIAVFDTAENELVTYSGSIFKLHNPKLRSLMAEGVKTIKIYTWALPTDPDLASRIRIRRVHLCTIELKG